MNFYQDFIVLRDRFLNFFQFQNIGFGNAGNNSNTRN